MTLNDFYPTPSTLIDKLLSGIKVREVGSILEPSAGKGDICDHIKKQFDSWSVRKPEIDCIEINPDLRHILKGKEYNVIHDDFLTFETFKNYGLIVANFPFSDGEKHLAKALQLLERSGGVLRCIVNAETIRNPYTKTREAVNTKLSLLGADVEYLSGEFKNAERPTGVEIALIKLEVEKHQEPSIILDSLKQAEDVNEETQHESLAQTGFMQPMVARFNLECRAGVKLINEYFSLKPYIMNQIPRKDRDDKPYIMNQIPRKDRDDYSSPLIELRIKDGHDRTQAETINTYLQGVRFKYWSALINDPRFSRAYTSNVIKDLHQKLEELKQCDFSVFNIQELEREMQSKIADGVEAAILSLFDEMSRKYTWYSETEGNIHYFNGWASNKAHKINKKVILPINGFSSYSTKPKIDTYGSIQEKLQDITKVFNYLSDVKTDVPRLVGSAIEFANNYQDFKNIDLQYFDVTFYKKGTCHIKFKDARLLEKFNIFGSQRKGWLPPAYGKKSYQDMTREEKEIVNEFQGRERYEEILKNSEYYLVEVNQLLLEA